MVILHVKKGDENQFLYETNTSIMFDELLRQLVAMHNLRSKIDRASQAIEELATKGPLKPEALRGLTGLDEYVKHEDLTVINGLKEMPPKTGCREVVDEHHFRTGWLVSEELCKQMLEEAMKAKQIIHSTSVDRKVIQNEKMLYDVLDIYKGLVMMAYPGYYGLGDYEPIRVILETKDEFID
jgi:cilia- and flagella-associated protein 298